MLSNLIFAAGIGQLSVLVASSLVPLRLDWKRELAGLSTLHRQMYWVYGGYVVLSIIAFGIISLVNAEELAAGRRPRTLVLRLCHGVLGGQAVPAAGVRRQGPPHRRGGCTRGITYLTVLFIGFTVVYGWAAVAPSGG